MRRRIDYDALATSLAALAYPLRLELLDILEQPHSLSEIRARKRGPEGEGRLLAKQTIAEHLEKLVETGFVTRDERLEGERASPMYAVSPAQLFTFTEEVRGLVVKHSGRGRSAEATGTIEGDASRPPPTGPRLVLVHGVYESRTYALTEATQREGAWPIGRAREQSVPLDYDPFISLRHTLITSRGGRYFAIDEGSKNGTYVNWERIPTGGSRELRRGDILGVGRSLLAFYDA